MDNIYAPKTILNNNRRRRPLCHDGLSVGLGARELRKFIQSGDVELPDAWRAITGIRPDLGLLQQALSHRVVQRAGLSLSLPNALRITAAGRPGCRVPRGRRGRSGW